MIHKSTEGGTHGKESRTKGSGEEDSGEEDSEEEDSEGRHEEEVIPSFSAPVAGRGGASFSPTTLCYRLKMNSTNAPSPSVTLLRA